MSTILKKFRSNLVAGAFVLLPVILSILVIYKLFQWLDNVLPSMIGIELPVGVGVLAIISITLFTGIIAKNYLGKKLIKFGNALIVSIPGLNKIFLTIQQIMDMMLNPQKNFLNEVVVVEYPKEDSWCIGFVTSRETSEISDAIGNKMICVYVPTTPNPTSGFMLYVPESKVVKIDMSAELAIKAIVSAGMVSSSKSDHSSKSDTNLAELIKKWKVSKSALKKAVVDTSD